MYKLVIVDDEPTVRYGLSNYFHKKVAGNWTVLATKSKVLNPGQTYSFKFSLNGGSLTLDVNGIQELTASDAAFSSGTIGLTTNTQTAQFDNVVVRGL